MKLLSFLLLLLSAHLSGFGQDEMVNVRTEKSVIHGGVPMSGVSTVWTYYFVVNKNIVMTHVNFENNPLKLHSGDTLIICQSHYRPYQFDRDLLESGSKTETNSETNGTFEASIRGSDYYVMTGSDTEFEQACAYSYKGKNFKAKKKEKIDNEVEHFAP